MVTRPGYILDYINGKEVRATPEEVEAVQVLARRLVEDFGYPKAHIQTRPQFAVRRSPSEEHKSYPLDIAVFNSPLKSDETLYIIAECKSSTRTEGLEQLRTYLGLTPAQIGVWFNGKEHAYLRKLHHLDGTITYLTLPTLPRYGQRVADIGLYLRRDLTKPSNLKAVFRDIRNHLAGMSTGVTRDAPLAQEIINILFCKILDEIDTKPDQTVSFRAGIEEPSTDVLARIDLLFEKVKSKSYEDVFTSNDSVSLDPESVHYVVGELQNYCLMDADRDAIGEAFEVFIGPALQGQEGQFFTPRNVVQMMVSMLDPEPGEKIIDPACGSGGFLIAALEHVWRKQDSEAVSKNWSHATRESRKHRVANDCLRGIDKDEFLAKVSKAYMALVGDGRGGIFCENSLHPPAQWSAQVSTCVQLGGFDVVLTNPPFGQKIVVTGPSTLTQFTLARKWRRTSVSRDWEPTDTFHQKRPPQILFLERCLQLLRPGGKLGIVLPESILGNPSYGYILKFLMAEARLHAVVTMPEPLFKTSGKGGTHAKVCVIVATKEPQHSDDWVFFADARWCGHDSRGNPTLRANVDGEFEILDDIPQIAEKFDSYRRTGQLSPDHLGFVLQISHLGERILVPKYYNPEIQEDLRRLEPTHELMSIRDLVETGVVAVSTGVEVNKISYGTGPIPFIRTSDLSNWELKTDFKQGISEDVYQRFKRRCDVRAGDILFVKDGSYLIGATAMIMESDLPLLYQSHLYRIRVLPNDFVDNFTVLACLNSPIVRRQVRSKQFTQDIIDTIGRRFFEIVVPVPREAAERERISRVMRGALSERNDMKLLISETSKLGQQLRFELDEGLV